MKLLKAIFLLSMPLCLFTLSVLENVISIENLPNGRTVTFDEIFGLFANLPESFLIYTRVFYDRDPASVSFTAPFDSGVKMLDPPIPIPMLYDLEIGDKTGKVEFFYQFVVNMVDMGNLAFDSLTPDSRVREGFYLMFDFKNKTTQPNQEVSYDLEVKACFRDNSVPGTNHRKYLLRTEYVQSISNLYLFFQPSSMSVLELKFYRLSVEMDTTSDTLVDASFFDFSEVIYQIIFYQEPADSIFLYNRSPFVYLPGFNGDPKTGDSKLHSFFSEDLGQTFWVGLAQNMANFVSLPGDVLSGSDTWSQQIRFVSDTFLYSWDQPSNDQTGFTVFSMEDANGDILFEIRHFLSDAGFNPHVSYTVKFETISKGNVLDSFDIACGARVHNVYHFVMDFYRYQGNSILVSMEVHSYFVGVHFIYSTDPGFVMSDISQMFIGHRRSPYNTSPIAYFFRSFHVVYNLRNLNKFGVRKVLYKNKLYVLDRWLFDDYTIWTPPSDPKLLESYKKELLEFNQFFFEFPE